MKPEDFPKDIPIIEDDDSRLDFCHIFSIIMRIVTSILALSSIVLFVINIVNKEDVLNIYLPAYCFILNILSFSIFYLGDF